ncbi:hypothetical protein DID73_00025 [Candidatus Marinamargulisbacteria bacterium SCGC AG-343-K17]|nr:hypothetical protein DID73_00025 [Candidatus Marinamargulisbacteria bacterium SCGC AG-343-K17]
MERLKQELTMSIKKQINELESTIENLKSNDLDFEKQIEVYQKTIKKISNLNTKIDELSDILKKTEITKNEL